MLGSLPPFGRFSIGRRRSGRASRNGGRCSDSVRGLSSAPRWPASSGRARPATFRRTGSQAPAGPAAPRARPASDRDPAPRRPPRRPWRAEPSRAPHQPGPLSPAILATLRRPSRRRPARRCWTGISVRCRAIRRVSRLRGSRCSPRACAHAPALRQRSPWRRQVCISLSAGSTAAPRDQGA